MRQAYDSPDLELADAATGKAKVRLVGLGRGVPTVLFAPDGRTVAATSTLGEFCLWSASTGRLLARAADADPQSWYPCRSPTRPTEARWRWATSKGAAGRLGSAAS